MKQVKSGHALKMAASDKALRAFTIFFAGLMVLVTVYPLYFVIIAREADYSGEKITAALFGKQLLNTVLLFIAMIAAGIILTVPFSCMMTAALITSPVIYQIATLLVMVFACCIP